MRLPHHPDVLAVADKVRAALAVPPGTNLVVACSGGPDSMCLADVVCGLGRLLRLGRVTLAGVDHGLRPEARRELWRVAELAELHEVDFVLRRVVVEPHGQGVMAAAREARYHALLAVAGERQALLLTGHTASDQAETVLMQLLRGKDGALRGIPARRGQILRPLLEVDRAAVERYLAARQLDFARDPSNADRRYLRSRVRHDLLPRLVDENDRLVERLANLAAAQTRLAELVRQAAREAYERRVSVDLGTVRIDRRELGLLPGEVLHELCARIVQQLGRELPPGAIRRLATMLVAGHRGRVSGTHLQLAGNPQVAVLTSGGPPPARTRALVTIENLPGARVRLCRPGDRFRPPRLAGRSAKLVDLYAQAGVPAQLRQTALVVESITGPGEHHDDHELVWAEHLGRAHGHTRTSLHIGLVRLP